MTWLSFKSSILGVLHRANESIKFRYCSILSSTLDYGYTNFHKFKQLEKLNTFALFSCYIRHNSSFAHEANSSENTILWRKMSTHQTFFHVQQMVQGYSKNFFGDNDQLQNKTYDASHMLPCYQMSWANKPTSHGCWLIFFFILVLEIYVAWEWNVFICQTGLSWSFAYIKCELLFI